VLDVNNGVGPLVLCKYYKKIFLIRKKQIFMGEKAFFFKTEMKISTFQDAGHNLNGVHNMSKSKINCSFTLAGIVTALVHALALCE